MAAIPKFSRRGRWVVPAGVVVAVAGVGIASAITVAQAAPALPSRTPAQLLAAVAGDHSALPPLTGTVVETAALGIPQLPGSANPNDITSLLAGSHTLKIWYDGPTEAAPRRPGADGRDRPDPQRDHRVAVAEQLQLGHQVPDPGRPRRPGPPARHAEGPAHPAAGRAAGAEARRPQHAGDHGGQRDGGRAGRLPARAGTEGQRLADRQDHDRAGRTAPVRAAAGAGVRQGDGQPGVPGRLHVDLVRHPRGQQLQLHPAARGEGAHGKRGPADRLDRLRARARQPQGMASGGQVIGKDWTAVAVLPAAESFPAVRCRGWPARAVPPGWQARRPARRPVAAVPSAAPRCSARCCSRRTRCTVPGAAAGCCTLAWSPCSSPTGMC